jgi:hypothetical protein
MAKLPRLHAQSRPTANILVAFPNYLWQIGKKKGRYDRKNLFLAGKQYLII